MPDDFRSDRMATPEGRGNAKRQFERAWGAYANRVNKVVGPVGERLAKNLGASATVDLIGFWLTWQTEGGYDGLRRLGMSRSAIYRRIGQFRKHMGIHPDEYAMPGVTINVDEYLIGTGMPGKKAEREAVFASGWEGLQAEAKARTQEEQEQT